MPQPHVVVVPYPGSGNINPALQLAQVLRHHGVFVTFVVTENNLRRARMAATGGAVSGREGFRIETIPDGLVDADRDQQDYDLGLSKATTHRCAAPLKELVARLRGGGSATPPDHDVPPVTYVCAANGAHELRARGGAGARRPQHGALDLQRGGAHGPDEAPGAQR